MGAPTSPTQPLGVISTSGSTAAPKIAVLSHVTRTFAGRRGVQLAAAAPRGARARVDLLQLRATFEIVNPATEEVLASVAHGKAENADRAVRAARAAFEDGSPWRRMPHGQRGRIVHKLGDLILEHLEGVRVSRLVGQRQTL